jgi:twitching motility protein PilT
MFLLDESLFKLWRDGLVEKEECLLRASKPAELAAKIGQAERGVFDEDEDEEDEDEDDDEEDDDEEDDDEDPPRRGGNIRRR